MSRDTPEGNPPSTDNVEDFVRWLFRHHNSVQRPGAVLKASDSIFWPVVMRTWDTFDAIPQHLYSRRFRKLRSTWSPEHMESEDRVFFDALPETFTAYRGGDSSWDFGLSWTLNAETAHQFARGHRNILNPDPEVVCMEVKKEEVAFAAVQRDEAEIVLFRKPVVTRLRRIPYEEPE